MTEQASSWAREFSQGATAPSLVACFGSLALALAQILLMCWTWTPERLAQVDPSRLMSSPYDYDAYVTLAANRLIQTPPAGRAVVWVSTSGGRHSIDDAGALAADLAERIHDPVQVELLATGAQTLWESAALLDALPDPFDGVALVTVGPSRLAWSPERLVELSRSPRLALDAASFQGALEAHGISVREPTGIYFLDHASFFLARRLPLLLQGIVPGPTYSAHRYPDGEQATEAQWAQSERTILERKRVLAENTQLNLEILAGIVTRVRARGGRVALIESPRHPRALELWGESYELYWEQLERFARERDLELWDLDAEAGVDADNMRDWSHIRTPEIRVRYRRALAARLAPLLAEPNRESS